MAGILTKGIKLSYKASGETYTELTNLMEIPEIGNGEKEMIDVTVLTDDVKRALLDLAILPRLSHLSSYMSKSSSIL